MNVTRNKLFDIYYLLEYGYKLYKIPGKLTYPKRQMIKLRRARRLSAEFAFAAYPARASIYGAVLC